jgi:hypothetical protein
VVAAVRGSHELRVFIQLGYAKTMLDALQKQQLVFAQRQMTWKLYSIQRDLYIFKPVDKVDTVVNLFSESTITATSQLSVKKRRR